MLSLHLCNEMHISAVSNIHFHVNLICINWKQDVLGFYLCPQISDLNVLFKLPIAIRVAVALRLRAICKMLTCGSN